MPLCCSVLMCHAPIVIPAIAGAQAERCESTTRAMTEAAQTLVAHAPDIVVVISPHAPRRPQSIGLLGTDRLSGNFSRFGHPEITVSFPGALEQAERLEHFASQHRVTTHLLPDEPVDHGAAVPLYFLQQAGYRGPVLLVALPYPGRGIEPALGAALRDAARENKLRWGIIASGDMSHRLAPDAPAGYDPEAHRFDEQFVAAIERGEPERAVKLSPSLSALAAEDVVQSVEVASAAVGYDARSIRTFGYEAPFGVGYFEALLYSDRVRDTLPAETVKVAQAAIAHALRGESYEPPALDAPFDEARAVFVTLRNPQGELRGCIGRTSPEKASLSEEIADCAVAAATRDRRMQPVSLDELETLRVDVSVLSPPEHVSSTAELDPSKYGVVVECGPRRGVLLPDIEGVDSVSTQLSIALRKGGISADEPYDLSRFTVLKRSNAPYPA